MLFKQQVGDEQECIQYYEGNSKYDFRQSVAFLKGSSAYIRWYGLAEVAEAPTKINDHSNAVEYVGIIEKFEILNALTRVFF